MARQQAHQLPRCGYTLPVFACAGAIAALQHLKAHLKTRLLQAHQPSIEPDGLEPDQIESDRLKPGTVELDLVNPAKTAHISIDQVALLSENSALAITYSDPGDNLDLTRHMPIWSVVSWLDDTAISSDVIPQISIDGGEGLGRHADGAAIYTYARQLIHANLSQQLAPDEKIQVTIILPTGRQLALRTSNAAFGVVDGLSLLGTSGIAQPVSAPGQLDVYRQTLRQKAKIHPHLVFCLGENGLDLALQLGIEPERRLKTGNWLGPLLVEAGLLGVRSILLFGYHGKLIKLAGGIFHTHHHIADARQEIMAACCAEVGLETDLIQHVLSSKTTEAALDILRKLDRQTASCWVEKVYGAIAARIDTRSQAYIQTHGGPVIQVGSLLFDRQRQVICKSPAGQALLP